MKIFGMEKLFSNYSRSIVVSVIHAIAVIITIKVIIIIIKSSHQLSAV